MAKYPHFARQVKFVPDTLRGHSSKIQARGYANLNMIGRKPLWPTESIVVERGDYKPDPFVGRESLTNGIINMDQRVSRQVLPTGRPDKSSNLIQKTPENGKSLESDNILKGYNSLGHFKNISAPVLDFRLIKSRDQALYLQGEMI